MSGAGRGDEPRPAPARAGFWATVRAVLWAYLGVRRRRDYHMDAASLDPKAVVVVGVLSGVLFVLILVAVVRVIVRAAGA